MSTRELSAQAKARSEAEKMRTKAWEQSNRVYREAKKQADMVHKANAAS